MMKWHRRSVLGLAFLMAAITVIIGACSDVLTPRRRPQASAPISRAWDQPDAPTAQLTPNPLNGSGSVDLVAHFPEQTLVRVIASGYVVQHDNFGMVPDANLGPNVNVAVVEVFPNGSTSAFVFPNNGGQSADTITMGFIPGSSLSVATRNPSSNLTRHGVVWNNQYIYCDTSTDPTCFTFTSGHTIRVEAVPASYSATADSAEYSIGSTATIAMKTSPALIFGSATPIHVDSALWVPAPDSEGGNSDDAPSVISCTNYHWRDMYSQTGSDWLCSHYVYGSGTLTMIGHANGFRQAPSIQISVRDPRLTLDASRASVHPNDSVVFTPKWSDGLTPAPYAWKWFPDSSQQATTPDCAQTVQVCKQTIRQSGTMKVWVLRNGIRRAASAHVTVYTIFSLLADRDTALVGSNVTFRPKMDNKTAMALRWRWVPRDTAAHDGTTCTADTACVKQMMSTGTMWAYTGMSGGDSASATVSVVADTSGCGSSSLSNARGLSLSCTGDGPAIATLNVNCYFPGGSSTRGELVRCETSVQPDSFAFTIINRATSQMRLDSLMQAPPYNKFYDEYTTADSTPVTVPAHATDIWEGPGVVQTTVTVRAVINTATGPLSLSPASSSFIPVGRQWSRWHWNEASAEKHDDVMDVGGYSVLTEGPALFVFPPRNTVLPIQQFWAFFYRSRLIPLV